MKRKITHIKARVARNIKGLENDKLAQLDEKTFHWVILKLGWSINSKFPFIHRAFVAIVQKQSPEEKENQSTLTELRYDK